MYLLTRCKRTALSLLALAALLPTVASAQRSVAPAQAPAPLLPTPAPATTKAPGSPATRARLASEYARLPLTFEPNVGQVDKRVRFFTHTGRGTLFLTDAEAVLTLPLPKVVAKATDTHARPDPKHHIGKEKPTPTKFAVLRMKLTGALKPVTTSGLQRLPGIVNYFRGNDPKRWHTHIPTYRQAKFAGVYKGVDMIYYGTQNGKLEYDFVVKPGADPKAIRLAFSGATGARVTANGDLALQTAAGEVRWQRPVTYQLVKGRREQVVCSYRLERRGEETAARFVLARYDSHRPLVIDPVLQYSTYLGGTVGDQAYGITVDSTGNAYITGATSSYDFPVTPGAFQTKNNSSYDPSYETSLYTGFVTKLNASGTALLYSTYLGGSSYEDAKGIAIDSVGNAYVTGQTGSDDFPVTPSAFQTTNYSSYGTGFVAKFAFGLTLLSLSPNNVPVGSGSFIGTVNGYGFAPGAKVLADGVPFSATFVSSTQLTVAVPQAALATAARVTVSVLNPDGSQSNSLLFNIGQPQVQLTSVTNLTRNPDGSISITLQITNIGTGTANAQLTGAILNGIGTTTRPLPGGPIPAGGTVSGTLSFPGTAGFSGQGALLSVTGTANGSSVNGFQPVTLP